MATASIAQAQSADRGDTGRAVPHNGRGAGAADETRRATPPPPPRPRVVRPSGARTWPPVLAGYDLDRGAYLATADHRWELNPYAMIQLQNVTVVPAAGAPPTTSFALRAAKFILHGHVLDTTVTYHFQVNFGLGGVAAEDIYLRWDPRPWLGVLVGQIETPFNRQHITLEAYQQLIDRSVVDQRFNLQRDLGAALYAALPSHALEATVGVWNGSRQNVLNDDPTYMLTARVAWNPWGPVPFRESDVEHSTSPRLSVAAAGAYNPRRVVTDAARPASPTVTREIAQGVIDATLRYRGLSVTTEWHARHLLGANDAPVVDFGALLQAGLFLLPRRLELAGRYGAVMSPTLAPRDVASELTGGLNLYLHGHRFKLQSDYSWLRYHDGTADHRVRFQLEFFL